MDRPGINGESFKITLDRKFSGMAGNGLMGFMSRENIQPYYGVDYQLNGDRIPRRLKKHYKKKHMSWSLNGKRHNQANAYMKHYFMEIVNSTIPNGRIWNDNINDQLIGG